MDEQQLKLFRTEVYNKVESLKRNTELGRRGRAIREELNWTQGFVAELIGCTGSSVSLWELGKNVPTGEQAIRYLIVIEAMENVGKGGVQRTTSK